MMKFFVRRMILLVVAGTTVLSLSAPGVNAQGVRHHARQVTVPTPALAALRGMLKANASVNAARSTSVTGALNYETAPALSTQAIIDAYNVKHQVKAHLKSISIYRKPIWTSAKADIVHARMVFSETLGQPKTHVDPIIWNYDFVMVHSSSLWKVADVLTYAPSHLVRHSSLFDLAPNIAIHSLSGRFLRGLEAYQRKVKYDGGKVHIDAFGYHVDKTQGEVRLYLFIHNGTTKPIFNLTGKLDATDAGASLFSTPLALSVASFGILLPGKTRFAVVHLPLSSLHNVTLTELYPRAAKFTSSFQYEEI